MMSNLGFGLASATLDDAVLKVLPPYPKQARRPEVPRGLVTELDIIIRGSGLIGARDGTFVTAETRDDRRRKLVAILRELSDYRPHLSSIRSLGNNHILFLVKRWAQDGETLGNIRVNLSAIRQLGKWIGKPDFIKPTHYYIERTGIAFALLDLKEPSRLTRERAEEIIREISGTSQLASVVLELMLNFGISALAALNVRPNKDASHNKLATTRAGRRGERGGDVPISTTEQSRAIERAREFCSPFGGFMYPRRTTLDAAVDRFHKATSLFGMTKVKMGFTAGDFARLFHQSIQAKSVDSKRTILTRIVTTMQDWQEADLLEAETFVLSFAKKLRKKEKHARQMKADPKQMK